MANSIGKYRYRVVRMMRTTLKNAYGQDEETFVDAGTYHAAIDETSDDKRRNYSQSNSAATTEIRLRNYQVFSANDRLRLSGPHRLRIGDVFVVDGVRFGTFETIVDCHRFTEA